MRVLRCLAMFALAGACASVGFQVVEPVAYADAPKKDLADSYPGQIFLLDGPPPAVLASAGWFPAHKLSKRDEDSDKKWPIHMMLFLKKPLDVNKVDLKVYRTDKKGLREFVQKIEQFPSGDGRSFYFLIKLVKGEPMRPNLKYDFEAFSNGGKVGQSEMIELTGKEERIGGEDLDFTKPGDKDAPKVEKATAPFDPESAKETLKKVVYEDCKTATSKGGEAKLEITFSKDGKVLTATFMKEPAVPYTDATQSCISVRFGKAKMKPFTEPATRTVSWRIAL